MLFLFLIKSLSKEEAGRANVALAFTIESLYYVLLKTQGIDPSNHRVKAELERIKPYIVKSGIGKKQAQPQIQRKAQSLPKTSDQINTSLDGQNSTTGEMPQRQTLNKKAAQNFIRRNLN